MAKSKEGGILFVCSKCKTAQVLEPDVMRHAVRPGQTIRNIFSCCKCKVQLRVSVTFAIEELGDSADVEVVDYIKLVVAN